MGSNIPFTASGQKLPLPFNPSLISGCQIWLDAADTSSYTLSGTNLTSWSDKSGTGKTFSFSGTPTYKANAIANLPTVVFNTTMLTTTFGSSIGAGDVAYFAVWIQYTNNSGILMSLGGTSTPALGLGCNGKYNLFEWGGPESDYNFTGSISYNQYVIQSGTIRSNAMLCSVNGYSGTNATSTQSQTSTTFTIGSSSSTGSGYKINGEVAEILVYVGTVSTAQQQQIEGYLAWKWGLQGSLNPSHPYATVNPDPPIYPVVPYPFLKYTKLSPEFDPRIFPGCILWLDGADPLATGTPPTSGTNITTWYDKSRSSNNFTVTPSGTTPAQAYLDGSYPTISWTSNYTNGMVSTNPVALTTNSSIFVVWRTSTSNASAPLLDLLEFGSSTTCDYGIRVNWTGQPAGIPNISVTNSNDAFYNNVANTTTLFYLNGTSDSNNTFADLATYNVTNGYFNTASVAFTTPTNIYIGYTTAFSARNYSGYIGEIILYQTAITETQRQQVEAYLAKKWGINPNLSKTNAYAPGSYLTFVNAPIMPAAPIRRAVQTNKFLPTQIGGLQLWLDAADASSFTLSGTSVTQWNDKSGLGNHVANANITGTLTYSSKTISTSGTSYFYAPVSTQRTTNTNFQVFMVYSWLNSAAGTNQALWGGDAGGWNRLQLMSFPGITGDSYILSWGNQGTGTAAPPNGISYTGLNTASQIIYHASYNGFTTNGSALYLNGVNQGAFTDSASVGSPNPVLTNTWFSSIGPASGGPYPSQIAFNEILIYNTTLTNQQRQQIEGYFAWKWGLKSSIGQGHPFFLIPPLPLP